MTAKNKKILIIGIIVVALVGIGIGLLFYFNDGYTYTPDGQVSNPNHYSDEIPFLEGVKMGMSPREVKMIERNKKIGEHQLYSEDLEDKVVDFYYTNSGEYAYSRDLIYSVSRVEKSDYSIDYDFRVSYYFSEKKLINVEIHAMGSLISYDYFYNKLCEKYGNARKQIINIGRSYNCWYFDKMVVRLTESDSDFIILECFNIGYDSKEVESK